MIQRPSAGAIVHALALIVLAGGCSATPDAKAANTADSTPSAVGSVSLPASSNNFVRVDSLLIGEPLRLESAVYVEQDAVIAARVGGILRSLSVDLGARVQQGQLLGRVDDDLQRLAVSRADVELARATRVVARARAMRIGENIAANELEDAEDAMNLATVAKREAEAALERTAVVAPFDGVVSARYTRLGRLLSINDTIIRVTARGPYLARLRVPEGDGMSLGVGKVLRGSRTGGRTFRARISRVAPAIDAASATREMIIQLPAMDELLPGAAIVVDLPRAGRRALVVPRSAISDADYVVVLEGRRTVMRPIMRGSTFGDFVEIRSGLALGDRVRRVTR